MSEHLPDTQECNEEYFGKSAEAWHAFLTTDIFDEPTGHLATPGSRYGDDADSCAWWAVGVVIIAAQRFMDTDSPELVAHEMMSDAVNGLDHIGALVLEELDRIPQVVLRNLTLGGGTS